MSAFAKLAAEAILPADATDDQEDKPSWKEWLATAGGLAALGGLGYLGYQNWDKIQGALGTKPPSTLESLNPLTIGGGALTGIMAPKLHSGLPGMRNAGTRSISGLTDAAKLVASGAPKDSHPAYEPLERWQQHIRSSLSAKLDELKAQAPTKLKEVAAEAAKKYPKNPRAGAAAVDALMESVGAKGNPAKFQDAWVKHQMSNLAGVTDPSKFTLERELSTLGDKSVPANQLRTAFTGAAGKPVGRWFGVGDFLGRVFTPHSETVAGVNTKHIPYVGSNVTKLLKHLETPGTTLYGIQGHEHAPFVREMLTRTGPRAGNAMGTIGRVGLRAGLGGAIGGVLGEMARGGGQ